MSLFHLEKNRIWRTYIGGKKIDELYGEKVCVDGHKPEVWIGSMVEANNPEVIKHEGLSIDKTTGRTLKDIITESPRELLGESHFEKYGSSMGILVKFLDAAERLTIQVHPNKANARKLFQSEYGKTEAWYILGGRDIDGEQPHIYYGFKEGISKELWNEYFKVQDIEGMLGCMHKIYVEEGQVFLIKGGMPHAIGAGCFILEIQEPTDYTIRPERSTPSGYEIPDHLCHQGLGFEGMMECFDFTGYTQKNLMEIACLEAISESAVKTTLISEDSTPCFGMEGYQSTRFFEIEASDSYSVIIVVEGAATITQGDQKVGLKKGDQVYVSADDSGLMVQPVEGCDLELIRCLPPN